MKFSGWGRKKGKTKKGKGGGSKRNKEKRGQKKGVPGTWFGKWGWGGKLLFE